MNFVRGIFKRYFKWEQNALETQRHGGSKNREHADTLIVLLFEVVIIVIQQVTEKLLSSFRYFAISILICRTTWVFTYMLIPLSL